MGYNFIPILYIKSKLKNTKMPNNFYQQASFLLSSPNLKGCPIDIGYEVAFAGRSNAGKSSTINALTSQNKLAKVSKTPGRTQHLVYFSLDDERRLVDLPGYGYSKVPLVVKNKWRQEMGEYFSKRQSLVATVLIMDIRHPLSPFDEQMLDWCLSQSLPTHIVLTKADKLSKGSAKNTLLGVQHKLSIYPQLSVQTFSALKKQNLEQLWQQLDNLLNRSI